MAAKNQLGTYWAVLIGVGFTTGISKNEPGSLSSSKDRSLKGPPQDIIAVNEYLKSAHCGTELPTIDISILTATKDKNDATRPLETPDRLPSLKNVTSSFKRILELAKPGAHVYIHYSGHGTRRKHDEAVALELVNQNSFAVEYLYGTVLRNAINRMIRQGLSVTLVLDCCFSGSVLRKDQAETLGIRYIEHDPDIDANSNYTDPFVESSSDEMRCAAVNLTRLLEPQGYTIVAACGPHEVASELRFADGIQRGALSYFLIDSLATLRRRGIKISSETLHQHLVAQFHVCLPEQTPMLFGNYGFTFFGDFAMKPQSSMLSGHRSLESGDLVLHAGEIHGLHKRDEYTISLSEFPVIPSIEEGEAIRGEISMVYCVQSRLLMVNPKDMLKIEKGSIWKANLVTSVSPRRVHIRLDRNIPGWDGLIESAKAFPFLALSSTTDVERADGPSFHVKLNDHNALELQDNTCTAVRNFESVPATTDGDHISLLNMLNQVSKFKFLEGIENQIPSLSFERLFELNTAHKPGKDGFYAVEHDKDLVLIFENLADHPLYLAIFIFTSLWEVRNLVSENGEDTCLPVLAHSGLDTGQLEIPLTMSIPDELQKKGHKQTEDIKIFVTENPSLFPGLILPRLGDTSVRGELDPLQSLLDGLSGDHWKTRNGDGYAWTTRSYFIRTYT